jgi:hypothetical protein
MTPFCRSRTNLCAKSHISAFEILASGLLVLSRPKPQGIAFLELINTQSSMAHSGTMVADIPDRPGKICLIPGRIELVRQTLRRETCNIAYVVCGRNNARYRGM